MFARKLIKQQRDQQLSPMASPLSLTVTSFLEGATRLVSSPPPSPPNRDKISAALYFMRFDNLLSLQKKFIHDFMSNMKALPSEASASIDLAAFQQYCHINEKYREWSNKDHDTHHARQQITIIKEGIQFIYAGAQYLASQFSGISTPYDDLEMLIKSYQYKLSKEYIPDFDEGKPTPAPKDISDRKSRSHHRTYQPLFNSHHHRTQSLPLESLLSSTTAEIAVCVQQTKPLPPSQNK